MSYVSYMNYASYMSYVNYMNSVSYMSRIVELNYVEINWNPKRVSNTKRFLKKYKWKEINYPSKIDEWKTFKKNNLTIALNILYIKEKEICPGYKSNINSNCEN